MCFRFITVYRANWRLLRRAVNAVGEECEQWTYEELDRPAEQHPVVERTVEGKMLSFQIDCREKKANGDLILSIDAFGLPTFMGVKPSYQFAKRTDGSVYYP